jgi:branched-chain amino acid transport system permease protein
MEITIQLIANGVIAAAFYSLMALGFTLNYSVTKFFNIAHGIFIPIGAYSLYVLVEMLHVDVYLSLLVSVAVCGFLGFALEKLIFYPLRGRHASGLILLVASLGIYISVQALLAMLFTSEYRTLSLSIASGTFELFGVAHITGIQVTAIMAAVLGLVGLFTIVKKTAFGKSMRAIADNPELAAISGINVGRVTGWTFFIGSAIAGLVGVLVGFDSGLEPTMGFSLMLKGIIAAVVGGMYSLPGAAVGALLLGLIESFGTWVIGGIWKDAIAFAVLIAFFVVRPLGINKR